jgi:hypothetical protein
MNAADATVADIVPAGKSALGAMLTASRGPGYTLNN